MLEEEKQTVAQYLAFHLDLSPKTQKEIARELGYPNANIITMFKQGLTRIPLDKIGVLAKALEIDPGELFYVVLQEYMPHTLDALKPVLKGLELTNDEQYLLDCYREFKAFELPRIMQKLG